MGVLDKFSLKGKVALVTGGAGLYGKQMVIAMAEAGATTYTASRNLENLTEFTDKLKKERNLEVIPLQYDQGNHQSIIDLKDEIVRRSGKIDILINNSVYRSGNIVELTFEKLESDLLINGTGLIFMHREFADQMALQGGGTIINIGSIYGLVGYDDWLYEGTGLQKTGGAAYYFNKGGMANLTKFFAGYYGPKGVRVNCIHPGGYETDSQPEAFKQNYSKKTFLKRLANDEDMKGILVFLASDASSYITGTNIPVDGGLTAK
ncbi:MAG: SDR family oxidoreductase [Clostridia bacterium]|nr:SDR family oxidoreductase [Clostridia bacterium]